MSAIFEQEQRADVRVKLSIAVPREFRNQCKAAAALDGYHMDEWIYAHLAAEVAKRLPDRTVPAR